MPYKYVFIDFTEGKRRDEEVREARKAGNGKSGRNFTLSRSLGFGGKGCLSSSRVRNRAPTGVPFTLADINGFQPIRAKWNG